MPVERSLLAAERETVAAANNRDAERLAKMYEDDAVLLLGSAPALAGKAAICRWIDGLAANRSVEFRHQNLLAEAHGGMGYTASRYEVTIVHPDGSRFEEKGRWVQIWRGTESGWKLLLEMSSPEAGGPPPAPRNPC